MIEHSHCVVSTTNSMDQRLYLLKITSVGALVGEYAHSQLCVLMAMRNLWEFWYPKSRINSHNVARKLVSPAEENEYKF